MDNGFWCREEPDRERIMMSLGEHLGLLGQTRRKGAQVPVAVDDREKKEKEPDPKERSRKKSYKGVTPEEQVGLLLPKKRKTTSAKKENMVSQGGSKRGGRTFVLNLKIESESPISERRRKKCGS